MKDFKIGGSSCHNIMGAKGLGEKGKTYVKKWITEQVFSRKYEFTSKYVAHGVENEQDALRMIKEYLKVEFDESNIQIFGKTEFMQGTCDLLLDDCIIDVKCSWDCFTFPFLETECPKDEYYWQAQVYMELFNKENYKLIYCLTDIHPSIIEKEARYYARNNNLEFTEDIYDKFYNRYTYTGYTLEQKVKVFDIKKNISDIEKIKERVKECREIIEIYKKNIK